MEAIGIDLGMTNCCVAYVKNNVVEVVPSRFSKRTSPSYISFTDDEILFGDIAKTRYSKNPNNTVYDVNRLIGRNYFDRSVMKLKHSLPFQILDDNKKIKVAVKLKGGTKNYSPEEIIGLLLQDLKNNAENYLDIVVTRAVITVPAYFTDTQRQATIEAGHLAGFEEIKLLNEPTAAAISYCVEHFNSTRRTILIFDFGGGTFDTAIIRIEGKAINVIAIDGDAQLGGVDITNTLFNYVSKYIEQKYSFDVATDLKRCRKLMEMCEESKHQLSTSLEAFLDLGELMINGEDLEISRIQFDNLIDPIINRVLCIVQRCLQRAQLAAKDMDDIIMVGGSSKIVKIHDVLQSYFQKPPRKNLNADEVVALGAAIVASKWDDSNAFTNLEFRNVCPYSLGVGIVGGEMNVFIPKYTTLPAKVSKIFCTTKDFQKLIKVNVYAGDENLIGENNYLGSIVMSGLKAGPAESIKFRETFEVNENGILTVSVVDLSTGNSKKLTIELEKGSLPDSILHQRPGEIEMTAESANNFNGLKHELMSLCRDPLVRSSIGPRIHAISQLLTTIDYSESNLNKIEDWYLELSNHLDIMHNN